MSLKGRAAVALLVLAKTKFWDPAGFTADGHCEIHLLGEGIALPSV